MSEYVYASSGEPLVNIDGKISLARTKIVRCKDCKYFYCLVTDACVCTRYKEKLMPWVQPDGFCAWGERAN